MTVNNFIEKMLENNEDNQQIIVIYDDNHNIHYIGKATFAPKDCWITFKKAQMVGNESRINDVNTETKRVMELVKRIEKCKSWSECRDDCYELCKIAGYEYKYRYNKANGNTWVQACITLKAARALGVEI